MTDVPQPLAFRVSPANGSPLWLEFWRFTWKEAQACLFAGLIATAICLNFFTHHTIGDYRWYLAAAALGLYARAQIVFRPHHQDRRMPLSLGLILVGFFIWLAENLGTFFGLWAYPHQLGAWAAVHVSKWSAWSLLMLMSFTIITNLKHIKATVQVPE